MHIIGKEKSHLLFNFQVPTIANKTCKKQYVYVPASYWIIIF